MLDDNDATTRSASSPLEQLPEEMINLIGECATPLEMRALTCASSAIYRLGIFKNALAIATTQAIELKRLVLIGKHDRALKMINDKPYLFFMRVGEVFDLAKDYTGQKRKIGSCSAFQTALAMGYTKLLNPKALSPIINKNPKIVAQQAKSQFPNGLDEAAENEAAIVCAFNRFIEVLNNDKFPDDYGQANDATMAATAKFKEAYAFKTVNQGLLFDLRIVLIGLERLKENWHSLNWRQRDWYACQIIGYLQTLVSVCDAKEIINGIGDLVFGDNFEYDEEMLIIKDVGPYYPSRPDQLKGVGVDSFMAMTKGAIMQLRPGLGGSGFENLGYVIRDVTEYIQDKHQSMKDLIELACENQQTTQLSVSRP